MFLWQGSLIFLFAVLTIPTLILIYPKYRKHVGTKKANFNRILIICICLSMLIYLFFGRMMWAWYDLFRYGMNDVIKIQDGASGFGCYWLGTKDPTYLGTISDIFNTDGSLKNKLDIFGEISWGGHIFANGADPLHFAVTGNEGGILQAGYYGEHLTDAMSLDLCPTTAFWLPVIFLIDMKYKTRIATYIAPWAIFGGLLSIFGCTFSDFQNGMETTNFTDFTQFFKFIFMGYEFDRLFFMMHWFMIVMGTIILLTSKVKIKQNLMLTAFYLPAIMCYAALFGATSGVQKHLTGTTALDWCSYSELGKGQFASVGELIGLKVSADSPLIWLSAFVGVTAAYFVTYALLSLFLWLKTSKKTEKYYRPIFLKNNRRF